MAKLINYLFFQRFQELPTKLCIKIYKKYKAKHKIDE